VPVFAVLGGGKFVLGDPELAVVPSASIPLCLNFIDYFHGAVEANLHPLIVIVDPGAPAAAAVSAAVI